MPVLTKDMVQAVVSGGASCRVDEAIAPKFKQGDAIQVRNINPVGHTRLPRYVRGKRGVIDRDHGVFSFPDTGAHGQGEKPQHVYSVRFTAQELWGTDAPADGSLYIDLFDDYCECV